MDECKAKAIQTNLGTFRHNETYPGIIQAYSGIFRTLSYPKYLKLSYIQNPDISRTRSILKTPAYSQHWYIQNSAIFRTLVYSKLEAYSEPCHTSTMKRELFSRLYLFSQSIIIFARHAALK